MPEYIEWEAALNAIRSKIADAGECGIDLRDELPGLYIAESTVEAIPTADVEPVRHGRWKYCKKQGIAVCAACSFERKLDDDFGRAIRCPNCGAKMDMKS